jgi:hypothetical protein
VKARRNGTDRRTVLRDGLARPCRGTVSLRLPFRQIQKARLEVLEKGPLKRTRPNDGLKGVKGVARLIEGGLSRSDFMPAAEVTENGLHGAPQWVKIEEKYVILSGSSRRI